MAVVLLNWAFWLVSVFYAMRSGAAYRQGLPSDLLFWLRANTLVAAFLPLTMALVTRSLVSERKNTGGIDLGITPWIGVSAMLAALCFSESFLIENKLTFWVSRGPAYFIYAAITLIAFIVWCGDLMLKARRLGGIERVEATLLTACFGFISITTICLNVAGHFLKYPELNRASIVVTQMGFILGAVGITIYRVFDARQILLTLAVRVSLAALLGASLIFGHRLFSHSAISELALFAALVGCAFLILPLDRATRRWFGLDNETASSALRATTIQLARTESNPGNLILTFERMLRDELHASSAQLLFNHGSAYAGNQLTFPKSRIGQQSLASLGWATPESLGRRRPAPAHDDLATFLRENSLGLIVAIPLGSPTPSLLIALGQKERQAPFTYPEVENLQAVGELMDNILAHSRLAAEAALQAKLEHLALMSRGLAHDLKNLLTPISTFIVHTDGAYAAATPEAEVHTAAKRSIRTMTDYVREALFFSSQLTPRFEASEPAQILATVRELSAARAAQRGVEVVVTSTGADELTVDSVLVQRLLGNLVANAIDASPPGTKVIASCVETNPGWARFEVEDHGVGIPPENLAKIFEPYFTTKDYGNDVRGFGLGLTICEKIVNLHQGTILVKSDPGRGTRITVDLPCAPTAFALTPENPPRS